MGYGLSIGSAPLGALIETGPPHRLRSTVPTATAPPLTPKTTRTGRGLLERDTYTVMVSPFVPAPFPAAPRMPRTACPSTELGASSFSAPCGMNSLSAEDNVTPPATVAYAPLDGEMLTQCAAALAARAAESPPTSTSACLLP